MPSMDWWSACVESPGICFRNTAKYCINFRRAIVITVWAFCNWIFNTSELCKWKKRNRWAYFHANKHSKSQSLSSDANLRFQRNHRQFQGLYSTVVGWPHAWQPSLTNSAYYAHAPGVNHFSMATDSAYLTHDAPDYFDVVNRRWLVSVATHQNDLHCVSNVYSVAKRPICCLYAEHILDSKIDASTIPWTYLVVVRISGSNEKED